MAATACVHSIFSTPSTGVAQRSTTTSLLLPSLRLPRQQRTATMIVHSMPEDKVPEQSTPLTPTPTPIPTPTPSPPPKPKMSTKFGDVLAFSGPAPERINGRLAMIGFVAAIAAEVAQGEDVVAQLANGGLPWFVATSVVFSLASLIPLFQGVTVESKSKGLMTSDAEMWNGRFAMLGLVALVFTEFVKGGALV